MSDELNPTAETAVETPVEEATEAVENTEAEESAGTAEESAEAEDEADSKEPEEPAVYQPVEMGKPVIINRFNYDIYIVNSKDEITLANLRESGKTFGNIVATACTANDQHDEVIVAIKR